MPKEVLQILVLAVVGFAWLYMNLKAGPGWLRKLTLLASLGFLGSASYLSLVYVFG